MDCKQSFCKIMTENNVLDYDEAVKLWGDNSYPWVGSVGRYLCDNAINSAARVIQKYVLKHKERYISLGEIMDLLDFYDWSKDDNYVVHENIRKKSENILKILSNLDYSSISSSDLEFFIENVLNAKLVSYMKHSVDFIDSENEEVCEKTFKTEDGILIKYNYCPKYHEYWAGTPKVFGC